tara:strand:+ start:1588 stop:2481 length:894 start_codon:yes stop_codon:yes gene_type:complete
MSKGSIIDAHVHHYPEEVFPNPKRWAEARGEHHWAHLVSSPSGKPSLQGWSNLDTLFTDMETAGIGKVVFQGWYWERLDTCNWHNDWQARWAKEHPEKIIALASVQPLAGNIAIDSLKSAYDAGLRGIGEVFPKAQGFSMQDATWLKMVEWAIEHTLPITLHVTEPVGHTYPGKVHAPLSDYQWLAETYPEATLIFAHWGGLLPFYELNHACHKAFKNVYYDTAASPLLYEPQIYQAVVDAVGADKVLFGSDYPLRLYPQEQSRPDFTSILEEIETSPLSEANKRKILFENAARIFK